LRCPPLDVRYPPFCTLVQSSLGSLAACRCGWSARPPLVAGQLSTHRVQAHGPGTRDHPV